MEVASNGWALALLLALGVLQAMVLDFGLLETVKP